jgi:DNA-binding transcriptional regulator YiaG
MEKKIAKQYLDEGFGFPIILENVPMVKVRGAWTPHINYKNLAREVIRRLVKLDGRLTGNQVKFIRLHLEMTLQAFAARFAVSHPAVLKWERAKNKPTGMSWGTEKDIRLLASKSLKETADDFVALYRQLETVTALKTPTLKVAVVKVAA